MGTIDQAAESARLPREGQMQSEVLRREPWYPRGARTVAWPESENH